MELAQNLTQDAAVRIVFDANFVAPRLGLTAEQFMSKLRQGHIYQVTERGIDDDRGQYRVIFRYRAKECRFILTIAGRDGASAPPAPDGTQA